MWVAVIAWGSLITEPGDLRIDADGWRVGGPNLPIELSRLSSKRKHLTYVIDETHSRKVPTRFGISSFSGLEDAISSLARREGCPPHLIGFVEAGHPARHRSRTGQWQEIREWLSASPAPVDAAVRTDLEPAFPGPFSLDAAVKFWRRLPAPLRDAAKVYAEEAPPEVDTDLRRRLSEENLIGAVHPA